MGIKIQRAAGAWLPLWLAVGLLAGLAIAPAQESQEDIMYKAAARAFQDGLYERAEKEFGDLAKLFPKSDRLAEFVVYQAQSRCQLKQPDGAIALLNAHLNQAGKWADRYRFWVAEAQYQRKDFAAAAASYAQMLKNHPDSALRTQACFGEALSWYKLGNLTNSIDLLRKSDGAFQKAAQAQPNDEFILRGGLLLAELHLLRQEFQPAEDILHAMQTRPLAPQLNWERQFLLIKVQLGGQKLEAAVNGLTNLLNLATVTGSPASLADSVILQGQALESARQPATAIKVYEQNLATLPPSQKRQALLKLASLHLNQTNYASAIRSLETLLSQFAPDPDRDHWRLALGELYLQQFQASKTNPAPAGATAAAPAVTNALQKAQAQFDLLAASLPPSLLLGPAQLNRGWCFLEAGKTEESALAFKAATEQLPFSAPQAIARAKWADAQFALKDFNGARSNYQAAVNLYTNVPGLAAGWFETNYHQVVRCSVELGDLTTATAILERMIALHPQAELIDDSMLLVAQTLNRQGKPAAARKILVDFIQRMPQSNLIPEAQIALARTYAEEGDWAEAAAKLGAWAAVYTKHPGLAQVEYNRAWVSERAGPESQALNLYTNFIFHFPQNPLAPLAQNAVADHYFNRGQFQEAEKNYQLLYQNTNWQTSDLAYRSRLWAGRSAFKRQGYSDATNYFVTLINLLNQNTNSPPDLLASAYFALGDTFAAMPSADKTNALKKFGEAIVVFGRISETNALAPQAWGRIADCHLQLASQDAARYTNAAQFYLKVMDHPSAQVAERSQAEIGLAVVFESQARTLALPEQGPLLKQALDHYLNVALEKNLRPGEKPDGFWLARAGLEGARLLEAQSKWGEAARLYERLARLMPNLKPALEKKLEQARKRL